MMTGCVLYRYILATWRGSLSLWRSAARVRLMMTARHQQSLTLRAQDLTVPTLIPYQQMVSMHCAWYLGTLCSYYRQVGISGNMWCNPAI